MPGAAAHIGECAIADELGESLEQCTVERLAVEFAAELSVVGTGDRVIRGLYTSARDAVRP